MKKFFNKTVKQLKSNKLFFRDAFLNMLAFAIYIFSQQIVLFPIMAKLLDSESYAGMILYITIMNVFCNVLGGQLGVTHQLQRNLYGENTTDESSDFTVLMLGASALIMICFPFIAAILGFDALTNFFITITVLLSNFRLYIRYYFRVCGAFDRMITQNLFYLVGILIGIGLYFLLKVMWLPLLLGEVAGLIYTTLAVPRRIVKPRKTNFFVPTLRRYAGLGSADALTNMVTLIDKLLIYPLLGAYSLAVYNAGTATSKVAALLTNPLNEVILVKLSKGTDNGYSKLIKNVIKVSAMAIAVIFVAMIPIIYLLSYALYRQYLAEICSIILLLSFSCAVGTTSSIMKSFILKYAKPQQITTCYLVNVCLLGVCGVAGAKFFGLIGFASAMAVSRIELWISFVYVLGRCIKDKRII